MSYTFDNYTGQTFEPYTGPTQSSYINPTITGDAYTGASDLSAKVTRAQWEDYKTRFQPVIDELTGYVDGTARKDALRNAQGLSMQAIDQGFEAAYGTADRVRSRYGLANQGLQTNSTALEKAKQKVNAMNQLTRESQDRALYLASGLGGTQASA